MTAAILRESIDPMAKKKVASVQISEDLVKSLRIVSALVDKPIATIIDEVLRPVVAKMEEDELAKHAKAQKKGGKP